jgi:hypothetical protein
VIGWGSDVKNGVGFAYMGWQRHNLWPYLKSWSIDILFVMGMFGWLTMALGCFSGWPDPGASGPFYDSGGEKFSAM